MWRAFVYNEEDRQTYPEIFIMQGLYAEQYQLGRSIVDFDVFVSRFQGKTNETYASKFLMIWAIRIGWNINKRISWITGGTVRREIRAEFIVVDAKASEVESLINERLNWIFYQLYWFFTWKNEKSESKVLSAREGECFYQVKVDITCSLV